MAKKLSTVVGCVILSTLHVCTGGVCVRAPRCCFIAPACLHLARGNVNMPTHGQAGGSGQEAKAQITAELLL